MTQVSQVQEPEEKTGEAKYKKEKKKRNSEADQIQITNNM